FARFGRLPIEDEGRLRNWRIRDHFLTAIFTVARFREAREGGKIRDLARFHAENQLLLMALGKRRMWAMGKIVANREGKGPREVFLLYEDLLLAAIHRPPRFTANINTLTRAEGYFRDRLTKQEKELFKASLDRYRVGLSPVTVPKRLVLSWIARFGEPKLWKQGFREPNSGERCGEPNLRDQTYFSPYPEELILPEGEAADGDREYR
ncbi:MAG TPA: DUF1722 domain-containing protein, partial [Methanomicrobiales archaeon]|nr:DUF1722 domain-containing protein [Methanomicrobiales archaeon]